MKIVFATNNKHKLEEAGAILGPAFEFATPASLGIMEDIPETQPTLEGNALQKARYLYDRLRDMNGVDGKSAVGVPTFADDTGLEVAALGGEPGVRSARYAEDAGVAVSTDDGGHDFAANTRLLLERLRGAGDRSARFRTVVALIMDGREYTFEGEVRGHIIEDYRGDGGFGYDPVFVPEGSAETFAQMSAGRKNAISHRARALDKLKGFLIAEK
jgi:XTP/dITP diphosphohydrolase